MNENNLKVRTDLVEVVYSNQFFPNCMCISRYDIIAQQVVENMVFNNLISKQLLHPCSCNTLPQDIDDLTACYQSVYHTNILMK